MRIIIAAILGGIIMMAWGMVSHMFLPVGTMGMATPTEQNAVLESLKSSATQGSGVYVYPSLPPEKMMDDAAVQAFAKTHENDAFAFVVYEPKGNSAAHNMGPYLIKQAGTDASASLVIAIVLTLGSFGFARGVLVSVLMGLFGWLSISVPYWNWYQFPTAFTMSSFIDETVGWLFAGIAISWIINRNKKKKHRGY